MTTHRPSPRTRRLAVTVAIGTLALAGCNASTPAAPATGTTSTATAAAAPTTAASQQTVAWTDSVCGALVPVAESLVNPPELDPGSPAATRDAYLAYVTRAQAATDRALQDLAAAGPAPVDGGQQVNDAVRADLVELRDDLTDARTQLEQVNATDAVAVGRAVIVAANVVGAVANSAQTLAALHAHPQLDAAFAQAQSCQRLEEIRTPGRTAASTAPATPTR